MPSAALRVAYDGPALREGTMPVRDLAPALLAFGHAVEELNRVANGDSATIAVNVRAQFVAGSFGIDLEMTLGWTRAVRDLLAGTDSTAIANLLAIITGFGAATKGIFSLIKAVGGRRVARAIAIEEGRVRIEFPDGTALDVPRVTYDAFRDESVRKAIRAALAPLDSDGVDSFSLAAPDQPKAPMVQVGKSDLPSFDLPAAEEGLPVERVGRGIFRIISLSFQEDGKWRLHDGRSLIWAKIEDVVFLRRVDTGEETFAKGDLLVCDVIEEQWASGGSIRIETRIPRVIDHIRAPQQAPLSLAPPPDPQP